MPDYEKVHLPGENPYVEVLERTDTMIKGRIANKLFPEYSGDEQAEFTGQHFGTAEPLPALHSFKRGDEVWFERGEFGEWEPVAGYTGSPT